MKKEVTELRKILAKKEEENKKLSTKLLKFDQSTQTDKEPETIKSYSKKTESLDVSKTTDREKDTRKSFFEHNP